MQSAELRRNAREIRPKSPLVTRNLASVHQHGVCTVYSPAIERDLEWTMAVADDEEELENEAVDADDVDPEDVDDEEIDDEDFSEEFADDGEFSDDEDEDDDAPAPAAKSDDDEDDDEPDPDDVEEDLDVILKDRLASGDDLDDEEEDDEDQVVAPPITATEGDKVAPKREGEWTCTGCFLIVSARQFGKRETATCPSGVSDCPSLEML